MLGRLLCWFGFHDWYQGLHHRYCLRDHCEEVEYTHGD